MRNALRTFIVGLMVVGLLVNPAIAWQCCGGGSYSSYAPVYYGGYGYGYDYGCGGCGGCEVVYDDCGGGCDSCGGSDSCSGCDSCGDCDSCGGVVVDEGVVVEHGVEETHQQTAPQPPAEMPAETQPLQPVTPPQQPATVERPADTEATFLPPETPAETPPAETPAEAPSDLFGTEPPAETPPADTAPATEPAAPAETPATPPADDDLFGGESTDAAPAATEPAPSTPPTETPATPPAEDGKAAEDDDLFGSASDVLREAGGLDSNEMRMWVDNTGTYSVNARLIRFIDGHVRLVKDTGRTTTVPLNRLSQRDLEFVNRQASAQKATTMQTAQVDAPSFGLANQ